MPQTTNNYSDYQLGTSKQVIVMQSQQDNIEIASALTRQASNSINIVSRLLDPYMYDRLEFIDTVVKLCTTSSFAKIRIIVFDVNTVVTRGHQLLNIASRFSSFIQIRSASKEYKLFNKSMLIVDDTGYLLRDDSVKPLGHANFDDRKEAKNLLNIFNPMWDKAIIDPNLRSVHL